MISLPTVSENLVLTKASKWSHDIRDTSDRRLWQCGAMRDCRIAGRHIETGFIYIASLSTPIDYTLSMEMKFEYQSEILTRFATCCRIDALGGLQIQAFAVLYCSAYVTRETRIMWAWAHNIMAITAIST